MRSVALYLRKSRADSPDALHKHDQQLRELAKQNGDVIEDVYREIVSGESISARFEFQKLLESVEKREVSKIYCHALDRLGRGDAVEYGFVLSMLRWTGTVIVTPGKTYDPTDDMDYQQMQFQMLFANVEYGSIVRRMKDGKLNSVRQGQYIGTIPPYGYDKAVIEGKKTLVKNSDAPIVRRMFLDAIAGKSFNGIASELNSEGLRTSRGKEWTARKIADIIRREEYMGNVHWGKYTSKRVSMDLKVRRFSTDYHVFDGLHEAIVTPEEWGKANAAAVPSPRNGLKRNSVNPLATVLYCAECGYSMRWVRGRYVHKPSCECWMVSSRADDVICEVIEAMRGCVDDCMVEAESTERVDTTAALSESIAQNQRKLDRLIDLYTDGDISRDDYRARKQSIEEAIDGARKALEAESSRERPEVKAMRIHEVIGLLGDDSIDAGIRNTAIKRVIRRIDYRREDASEPFHIDIYLSGQ